MMSGEISSKYATNDIIKDFHWQLDTIPPELFLHICSFLNAKFVINVLSQVCEKFKNIIEDDWFWRNRIFKRWPKRYPVIKPSENFDWKNACIEREEHHRLWTQNAANMKEFHIKDAHFTAVDVILVIENGRLCVTGSRDHCLKAWDLHTLYNIPLSSVSAGYSNSLIQDITQAHAGWIWSMAYRNSNHTLFTGSWDCFVKSWDLRALDTAKDSYSLKSPVLCLAFSDNVLACGMYDRNVALLDPRSSTQPLFKHTYHTKSVLCLVADDKFIISGSEDGTIVVFNRIAGKAQSVLNLEGYPMCLSYGYQHLWVGDRLGFIHLLDPTNENFNIVETFTSGHKRQITGIQHTLGSIITCSLDKSFRILEPSVEPQMIFTSLSNSEIAGISNYETTLACAHSDSSITVWMPNDMDFPNSETSIFEGCSCTK